MDIENIRGAIAKGYCAEGQTHKELDADLCEVQAQEVLKLLPQGVDAIPDSNDRDVTMNAYAIIDPNWGEPKILIKTLADTSDGAIARAITIDELALYSGSIASPATDRPRKYGSWANLTGHGYEVKRVTLEITEHIE